MSEFLCDLVLVAGGSGTRISSEIPKQFEMVSGRPLYLWALDVFLSWPRTGKIVIVTPDNWTKAVVESFEFLQKLGQKKIIVVSGGRTRQASSKRGLEALGPVATGHSWVMIHDAARPMINHKLLDRLWEAKNFEGERVENLAAGVIPGVKPPETIKQVFYEEEITKVMRTLPRDQLRIIQTPQLFKRQILLDAYESSLEFNAVDDASLVESLGYSVRVVDGDQENIKVTFAEDRERVSNWLRQRHPPI